MGLRHMFVGPPHPLVAGMLTRKDIITGGSRVQAGLQRWWVQAGCVRPGL